MIGNAVPVPMLASVIGDAIAQGLLGGKMAMAA